MTTSNNIQNEIKTRIAHYEIYDTKIIVSTIQSTYFCVNAEFSIEVKIGNTKYYANLETGSSFYHADYCLPSNQLSVEAADELLKELNELVESDFDKPNTIAYINDVCDTDYTQAELLAAYNSFNEAINSAQSIVNEVATGELQAFEDDKRIFVLVTHYDYIDFHNPAVGRIKTGECVEVFDNDYDVQLFIDHNNCRLKSAKVVDKAIGYKVLADTE